MLTIFAFSDTAYGIPAQVIFDSLKSEYDLAISKGAKVLGMTIPERAAKSKRLEAHVKDLNSKIMGYKHDN